MLGIASPVMTGLDPAIWRGTVLEEMAGSGPGMTKGRVGNES